MKAVIALLCLVVLATAHRGPHRHGMRPTEGPDGETWQERMERMKKEHEERRKQMEANRPTGRPQSWRERLEKMKKDHEERMKQWEAIRPTGRPGRPDKWHRWGPHHYDADETHIRFGKKPNRWNQRPTGRPTPQSWKERVEQWKKDQEEKRKQWEEKKKQMEANRPTGRPQSWRERLEQMKKEHEERRKQWEARRPTGQPFFNRRPGRWGKKSKKTNEEDETALIDQLSKWRQMWNQRPTGRPMTWRQRLAAMKKAVEEKKKQMAGKKLMTWAEIKKTIEERKKAWAEKLQKLKAAKNAKDADETAFDWMKGDKDSWEDKLAMMKKMVAEKKKDAAEKKEKMTDKKMFDKESWMDKLAMLKKMAAEKKGKMTDKEMWAKKLAMLKEWAMKKKGGDKKDEGADKLDALKKEA